MTITSICLAARCFQLNGWVLCFSSRWKRIRIPPIFLVSVGWKQNLRSFPCREKPMGATCSILLPFVRLFWNGPNDLTNNPWTRNGPHDLWVGQKTEWICTEIPKTKGSNLNHWRLSWFFFEWYPVPGCLTYPLLKVNFEDNVPFPKRWDMWIP